MWNASQIENGSQIGDGGTSQRETVSFEEAARREGWEDQVTKDEALEAAWQIIGGKAAFNADEIAWMEAMANSADRIDGELDASFQRALESGKIRQESSICLVAFMMEFCRLYIGE